MSAISNFLKIIPFMDFFMRSSYKEEIVDVRYDKFLFAVSTDFKVDFGALKALCHLTSKFNFFYKKEIPQDILSIAKDKYRVDYSHLFSLHLANGFPYGFLPSEDEIHSLYFSYLGLLGVPFHKVYFELNVKDCSPFDLIINLRLNLESCGHLFKNYLTFFNYVGNKDVRHALAFLAYLTDQNVINHLVTNVNTRNLGDISIAPHALVKELVKRFSNDGQYLGKLYVEFLKLKRKYDNEKPVLIHRK